MYPPPGGFTNFNSIDVVKFIMSIFVVWIHSFGVEDGITGMAVPFFFMSSGYLYGVKIRDFGSEDSLRYLSRHEGSIFSRYIIWSVMYLPIVIYSYSRFDVSLSVCILHYLVGLIFTGSVGGVDYPYWYLLSTSYALSFYIWCRKKHLCNFNVFLLAVIFMLLSLCIDNSHIFSVQVSLFYVFNSGRMLRGLFYLIAGLALAEVNVNPKYSIGMFCAIFAFSLLISDAFVQAVFLILYSVLLFSVVISVDLVGTLVYSLLRRFSIYLFFSHMFVMFFVRIYVGSEYGFMVFSLTMILCVISFIVSLRVRKLFT